METPKCTEHICSRNFKVLLVGGFGAKSKEVKEAAWKICKWLFDYSERARHEHYQQVKSVINKAKHLRDMPRQNVEDVQKFVAKSAYCIDGITSVVIAHSHGAKIVRSALHPDSFTHYLQTIDGKSKNEAEERLRRIRNNLAVFTIGGIDILPDHLAKIVVNLRLAEDAKSFFGEKLYGEKKRENETSKTLVISNETKTKPTFLKKAFSYVTNIIYHDSNVDDSNVVSSLFIENDSTTPPIGQELYKTPWMIPMSSVSSGRQKHALSEYVYEEELMNYIVTSLSLDSDIKCGCDQC